MSEKFYLKWNDFKLNVTKYFSQLRNEDDFFDVTLVSDDKIKISAHKLVLSSSSEYFKTVLQNNKHSHPLLCLEGVSSHELNDVLDYVYNGEINISQDNLERFLQIASRFQLEGLIGGDESCADEVKVEENTNQDISYDTFSGISEKDVPNVSSAKMPKQKSNSQSVNSGKNTISVNPYDIANAENIDEQIEELIEKVGVRQYKCKPCRKISMGPFQAKEHAETHIEGLSFNCQMCDKTYRTKQSYRMHITQRCPLRNNA